ncbi:MAG: GcpE protein, partial [Anaerospora sp.]|nr:GcpE protein [Anaerospora sp.]
MERKKTRFIQIGDRGIGSNAPISVQSMTTTKTDNVEATARQI